MSVYPGALDSHTTTRVAGSPRVGEAAALNNLADAVNKIESTLGLSPQGAETTVSARIAAALTAANAASTTAASASTVATAAIAKSVVDAKGDLLVATAAD